MEKLTNSVVLISQLDRMEFVIGNPDGMSFSYTLDSNVGNVFSLRHLLEQNISETDAEMSLRRESTLSPDNASPPLQRPGEFAHVDCDLLDIETSQLDPLESESIPTYPTHFHQPVLT